jgi:hypothetical protein
MAKGIVKVLEDQVQESESGSYEVGEQRERNHRFFTQQPIGNEQQGRSQYVSPDVMESVESKKALCKETFLSNRQTVKFKGGNLQTPFEADAKTAYTNKVFRRNKHTKLFRDGWHDAFVAKREVVYVDWEESTKTVTLQLNNTAQPQLMQLIMSQGEVVSVDPSGLKETPMPTMNGPVPMFSGELKIEVDDSYVGIELVTPERFYRDPMAAYPEDSEWCTWERDLSRGTLVEEGFDEDQVMGLKVDYRFRSNEEDSARKAHDKSWTRRQQYDRIETQSNVTSYRTWTKVNLTDDQFQSELQGEKLAFEPVDEVRLYKICWAHGEVLKYADGTLAIEEYEEMPFLEWSEIKISHAEHGMCSADIEAHTQKVNSTLKRLIIDNQQMTNNTRYEAVINSMKNPRDLLDNKIGTTIWTRKIGSVAPLPAPQLSPLTFNVLEMMKRDSEARDGYSDLAKGMNTDAVKHQNADSMIERLTTAGQRRPMSMVHDWAENFLIPLSQMIVKIAMTNDKSQTQLEVRGRMIPVVPSQWKDDTLEMETSVALTPQENKEFAQSMLMMHQVMSADEELNTLYNVNQKHALMDSVFDALGISDTTPYMMRPDSPEYAQAQQQRQAMMMEEKQKADTLAGLQVKLAQSGDRREWESFKWKQTNEMSDNLRDEEKDQTDREFKNKNFMLDLRRFDWEKLKDVAEYELEKDQRRPVSVGP